MNEEKKHNHLKGSLIFLLGAAILILGITLILSWWPCTVLLFKGAAGIILALAGMLMLFLSKR